MTIREAQEEIIESFAVFDDWLDRYEYLIGLGGELPPLEARCKTNEYLIEGCQSRVWLYPELHNDRVVFRADSDAEIPKGIVSLLLKVLSNRTPDEILDAELYFIDSVGLKQNLSPTRSNGLMQMVKQMKLYAMAYKATMLNP
ncbi:MAG: SufE family protein [Bacteroidales bacterium]